VRQVGQGSGPVPPASSPHSSGPSHNPSLSAPHYNLLSMKRTKKKAYLLSKLTPSVLRSIRHPPLPPPSTKTSNPHLLSLRILPNYLFGPSRINHQRIHSNGVTRTRRHHPPNPRTLIPPWVLITASHPLPPRLFRRRKRKTMTTMVNLKAWSFRPLSLSRALVASNSPKSWR
jgi:hypothetical protein